jgi:hypothetical protein
MTEFGSGYGASDKMDEVVIHQDRDYNYIVMYVPYDKEVKPVPHTTRKEVFCRETTEFKGSGGFKCKVKPETKTDAKLLERTLNTCITFAKNFGEDFEEYPNKITNNGTNCIELTEEVFGELESIAQRFNAQGVTLSWKKRKGRKPEGEMRLSEISWSFKIPDIKIPDIKPKQKFTSEKFIEHVSVAEHILSQ